MSIEFEIKVGINTKSDKTFIDAGFLREEEISIHINSSRFRRPSRLKGANLL